MKNLKDSKIVKFGNVIWITGLSGSGKSTLAKELVLELGKQNKSVLSIDGDDLRKVFGSTSNYDRSNRLILAKKYSALCGLISKQGFDVVISTVISPFVYCGATPKFRLEIVFSDVTLLI